jgi:hypothetical protein
MKGTFKVFRGTPLFDFSSPILIVSLVGDENFSRSECFLIRPEKVTRKASTYRWFNGMGYEIRERIDEATLEKAGIDWARILIKDEIAKVGGDQLLALHRDFEFVLVDDPKSMLITEQLLGRLPSLSPAKGTRCTELRILIEEVSVLKPIIDDGSPENWND